MAQKSKTFFSRRNTIPGIENEMASLDEEISEFLADGKRVIHMDCSVTTRNHHELVYLVTLIYEDPALATAELDFPLAVEASDEAEIDRRRVEKLFSIIGRKEAFSPARTREPAIAATAATAKAESNINAVCKECKMDEGHCDLCQHMAQKWEKYEPRLDPGHN